MQADAGAADGVCEVSRPSTAASVHGLPVRRVRRRHRRHGSGRTGRRLRHAHRREASRMTEVTMEQILDCPMSENDADAKTVRDYLGKLLLTVWIDGEDFDG